METTEIRLKVHTEWLKKIKMIRKDKEAIKGRKISQNEFLIDLIREAAGKGDRLK